MLHSANSFKEEDLPGVWYWSLFNIYLTGRTDYNPKYTKYIQTEKKKKKAKSVPLKTPWMFGSQLAVYYQHSDQVSQSSLQLSIRANGAQDLHVNCNLKLSGKMTC